MCRIRVLGILLAGLLLGGSAHSADERPKSAKAEAAAKDFEKEVARLDEDYRKLYGEAKAVYVKRLDEARADALEKKDLEEAQRIVALVKGLEDESPTKQMLTARQRLANSTWTWSDNQRTVTLHSNGTLTTNWMKDAKGGWMLNPDLTVTWWSTGHPWATIMKFNKDFTTHESYVPEQNIPRSGKRLK